MIDVDDLKRAATGRWPEILSCLGGIEQDYLDGRHHPCPKCGGGDRFRMIDREQGAVLCNQCFSKENGDGLSALQWANAWDFRQTITALGDYLGLADSGITFEIDIVTDIARRKRMPLESFKAFGAHEAMRGKLKVARVPMFDEDGKPCSHFDLSSVSKDFEKGMSATGMPVGLFVAQMPAPDDTVLLTEGVKDAAALHGLGYLAVGLPTKEMDVRFARLFADCDCIIVPDRDEPGEAGAEETASRLKGIASRVRIATLPAGLKDKGGDGVREVLGATQKGEFLLRRAIADARDWKPKSGDSKRHKTLLQACHACIDGIESGKLNAMYCGIEPVDDAIGGMAFGEMIVIGARPSHGKTMFALQHLQAAAAMGLPGLIVSEEMSALGIGKRTLNYVSDLSEDCWHQATSRLREAVNSHFEGLADIHVAESCGTAEKAVAEIDRACRDHGVRVVAVDYAQLLRGVGSSRYEQVTSVSVAMKQAAVRNNVILLLLCQLSREIEKRPDRTPKMSDLRDSGQIEQDADVVLFLQWPLKDDPAYKPFDEYRVFVAKNRNRGTKKPVVVMRFTPSRQMLAASEPKYQEFDAESFGAQEF